MQDEAYEIRVEGDLPTSAREALTGQVEGLRLTVEPVASVMVSSAMDQAALHGLLDRLHALGLVVLEVRRVPEQRSEDVEP